MRQPFQMRIGKETRGTLHRVDSAKNFAQKVCIGGPPFKRSQAQIYAVQTLTALRQELFNQIVHTSCIGREDDLLQ